jgi:hypothetical protein
MPLRDRYLADLNMVLILGTGTVTADDFIAVNYRQRDASHPRDRDVLVDLRRIDALVLEPDTFAHLVALDTELHEVGGLVQGRRRVVVGRGDLEDAMTQLYRAMLQREPGAAPTAAGTVSFRTLEDALVFLQRSEARASIEEALEALAREGKSETPPTS